ncbi:hypothetical protein HYDPIDRAFT_29274 [Hydnomerulius pinastri MD-312]|uniref:Peptidase C14 caspase domain-containing protein n=1 Tax=Hydnomerulius pinastri MD-312 TaxID=994086 RepID=A0A0C9WEL8_9AGAM|nr:hypothetical protein HYDPIDRAFT_29274 [Hydnomerulius pinastri MD-312]
MRQLLPHTDLSFSKLGGRVRRFLWSVVHDDYFSVGLNLNLQHEISFSRPSSEKQNPELLGTAELHPPRLFALIIGINQYKSLNIRWLRGAVADANIIQDYLQNYLAVPSSQICNLRDSAATRAAIVQQIRALASDHRIQHGDPVLIYYAGHGSTIPTPVGWEAGGPNIQVLVPYDYDNREGGGVPAIEDRFLGRLLGNLASEKGDNITVIFDCCHSGSGTRTDEIDSSCLVRGIDIPGQLPKDLDQDVFVSAANQRATEVAGSFTHSGLRSHVFLAACGATETAQERDGRGFFTEALVEVLVNHGTKKLTYKSLLHQLKPLPGQNPQCEGVFQNRILFDSKAPSQDRVLFKICRLGDSEQYVMDAGAAHGITDDARFAVYRDRESALNVTPLGIATALRTDPYKTELRIAPGDSESQFSLPKEGFALQTRTGKGTCLHVHIERNKKFALVINALEEEVKKAFSPQRILFTAKEEADLDLTFEESGVVINLQDSAVTKYGLTRTHFVVEPTVEALYTAIHAAAHFYWHLRRKSNMPGLHKKISVEVTELVRSEEEFDDELNPVSQPVGQNLICENVVDLRIKEDAIYGFKITNNSNVPLYVSLFYFDNSDFSIMSYYQPPTGGGKIDQPLLPRSALAIGYGAGGGVPTRYFLRDGQDVDVGYLKLFLSREHVDLSHIPQQSPNSGDHRSAALAYPAEKNYLDWDTILIPVIQQRA